MAVDYVGGEVIAGFYGSAQWGDDALASLPAMLARDEGSGWIPLGRSAADPNWGTVWNPCELQGHALTFAPTRSGKGVSAIIPALLTYAGSCLVVDPKGENFWLSGGRRAGFGQRIVCLDPWGEVERRYAKGQPFEGLATFNPLASLDPGSPNFADDVAGLAAALVVPAGNDPHWGESARELIGGIIAATVEFRPGSSTLADVRELLLAGPENFKKAVEFFQETNPGGLGSRKLDAFKESSKEVESIRSTARTQTAFLDSESLRRSVGSTSEPFNLAELGAGRVTLYLVIPPERLETHGRWLRLIMTMALQACARQAQPAALPVLFLLDEFGTIGRLPMVEQAFGLNAGSGAGVRLWCFLQDLNQLKRDYPQSWETFISNASVVQVLACRDITSAEYLAKAIGETSTYRTRMTIYSDNAEHHQVGGYRSDKHDVPERDVQRPLVYAAEIMKARADQQIILYSGYNPIKTGRFVYYDTLEWAEKYRPIPGRLVKTRADFPGTLEHMNAETMRKGEELIELVKYRLDWMDRNKWLIFPIWLSYELTYPLYSKIDHIYKSIFRFCYFKQHHYHMQYLKWRLHRIRRQTPVL